VYYVASPEACAAILWKSRDKAATVSTLSAVSTQKTRVQKTLRAAGLHGVPKLQKYTRCRHPVEVA